MAEGEEENPARRLVEREDVAGDEFVPREVPRRMGRGELGIVVGGVAGELGGMDGKRERVGFRFVGGWQGLDDPKPGRAGGFRDLA